MSAVFIRVYVVAMLALASVPVTAAVEILIDVVSR